MPGSGPFVKRSVKKKKLWHAKGKATNLSRGKKGVQKREKQELEIRRSVM